MRYDDIFFGTVGVQLGQLVRTPAAVRRGLLSLDVARNTGQRSVSVAKETAAELAVAAARSALHHYASMTHHRAALGLHLHATTDGRADSWATPGYVLEQLPIAECGTATALTANGILVLDIAATMLQTRPDLGAGLVTATAWWGQPGWDRYGTDYDVLYGDAGAAAVLTRGSGFARLLATATITDPSLAGYTCGIQPNTAAERGAHHDTPIDLRARKAAWLTANGGVDEFLRRNAVGVTRTLKAALADADLSIQDMRWILTPFLGADAAHQQWLRPLDIDDNRTLTALGLHFGHLGPADQLVALDHLAQTSQLTPGDHVLLAGTGAGMTWSAAVLRIEATS